MTKLRLLGLALAVAVSGCGSSSGRIALEGTVTYEGQPVGFGTIQFDPDTQKGGSGVQGSAEITNGRYKTLPEMGPTRGPHLVRVTGYERKPESPNDKPLFVDARLQMDIAADAKVLDIVVPPAKK